MEVSVQSQFVLKLTSSEFRLICLALDDRPLTTDEDERSMRDLAGRLMNMRSKGLNDLACASEHAEEKRSQEG